MLTTPTYVCSLCQEAQRIIRRKIADLGKDGWLVIQECESDDLASNSDDEKRLRKAKNTDKSKPGLSLTVIISFSAVIFFPFSVYFVISH